MTTKVSALQSPELGAPLRYLEHMYSTSKNFLEALEVTEFAKKDEK